MTLTSHVSANKENIVECFQRADEGGLLKHSDIAFILKGLDTEHWTEQRIEKLLKDLGSNEPMTYQHFVDWLFGHVNVYCDGIYDLCHMGHKNAFRNAASWGTQLFVGVVGDTDANNYKRPPIMSASERELEVANCKCVTKVIQNAPCFGMTLEFIKQHNIHIICCGQEYFDRFPDPEDDPYYKVPRKMGICKPIPRYDGISTSELLQRILDRGTVEKKSPT